MTIGEYVAPDSALDNPETRPIPVIHIRTKREFGCLLPLDLAVTREDKSINVEVKGIGEVELCPSAVGPATGIAWLPFSAGTYALRIADGKRADSYLLRISDDAIALTPQRTAFTSFDEHRFQRAPRYSFAFYCSLPWRDDRVDSTHIALCTDFQEILTDSLGATAFGFDSTRGVIPFPVRNDLKRSDVVYYRLRGPSDFRRAYDLLQRFSRDRIGNANVGIELQNWRGTLVSSYVCRPDQTCSYREAPYDN